MRRVAVSIDVHIWNWRCLGLMSLALEPLRAQRDRVAAEQQDAVSRPERKFGESWSSVSEFFPYCNLRGRQARAEQPPCAFLSFCYLSGRGDKSSESERASAAGIRMELTSALDFNFVALHRARDLCFLGENNSGMMRKKKQARYDREEFRFSDGFHFISMILHVIFLNEFRNLLIQVDFCLSWALCLLIENYYALNYFQFDVEEVYL